MKEKPSEHKDEESFAEEAVSTHHVVTLGTSQARVPFSQLSNSTNAPVPKQINSRKPPKMASTNTSASLIIPKERVTLSDHFKAVKIESLKVTLTEEELMQAAPLTTQEKVQVNGPHL